jgi:pullulanase/glycogen debranching enzyme
MIINKRTLLVIFTFASAIILGALVVSMNQSPVDIYYMNDPSISKNNSTPTIIDENFVMDGYLRSSAVVGADEEFSDVHLCLYNKDGSVAESIQLRSLEKKQGAIKITINRPVKPEYVIFRSPDFWSWLNRIDQIDYYVYDASGDYERIEVSDKKQYPFEKTAENC